MAEQRDTVHPDTSLVDDEGPIDEAEEHNVLGLREIPRGEADRRRGLRAHRPSCCSTAGWPAVD